MLVLLLAAISLYLLQKPKIQSYLVHKASDILSQKLDTEVSVERVDIDIFNRIVLEGVYIEDWNCDTLVYVEKLHADIIKMGLLEKQIILKGIELEKPYIHIEKTRGDPNFNFQYVFNQFSKKANDKAVDELQKAKDTTKASGTFDWIFELDYLTLNLPRFIMDDQNNMRLNVELEKLDIGVDSLSVLDKHIGLRHLDLIKPIVSLKKYFPLEDKEEDEDYDYSVLVDITPADWMVKSKELILKDGQFSLTDYRDTLLLKDAINFKKLRVNDIQIIAENASFGDNTIMGKIAHLSAKEQSGFVLKEASAEMMLTPKKLELVNLDLRTPNSHLKNYLAFNYRSLRGFYDFVNEVKLNTRLAESYFTFKDITYFAGALLKVDYIQSQRDKKILVSGLVSDKISKIKGDDLWVRIDDTSLRGDVRMRGLPDFESTMIDFEVAKLKTGIHDIKTLFPQLKLPPEFDKLTTLDFEGRFTGFPKDFVADGRLITPIGKLSTDLKMELNGTSKYSGDLSVTDFDLGEWLNKKEEFGKITFSSKINGSGFNLEDLNADINGNVKEFTFRNYTYRNVKIDGNVKQKLFNGLLAINDANVHLDFQGSVNLNNEIPQYSFKAKTNRLRLSDLNLLKNQDGKDKWEIVGYTELDLTGNEIDNIVGTALFKDVQIKFGDKVFNIGYLNADSDLKEGIRNINIASDILDAQSKGAFTFKELPFAFKNYLATYFPYRFEETKVTKEQEIAFDIDLKNPIGIIQVFDPKIEELNKGQITGYFNTRTKEMALDANIPSAVYDGNRINNFTLKASSDVHKISFNGKVFNIVNMEQEEILPEINLVGHIANDTIDFALQLAQDTAINNAFVEGILYANRDTLKMELSNTAIVINREKWEAGSGKFVFKDKNYFVVEDLILYQGDKSISLTSIPSRFRADSTTVNIKNINLSDFGNIAAIQNLELAGTINGKIFVEDLFKEQIIDTDLTVDSFSFRQQVMGDVWVNAQKKRGETFVDLNINVENENYQAKVESGRVYLPKEGEKDAILDLVVNVRQIPVSFLNAFVGDFVSNLQGIGRGKISITGPSSQPELNGNIGLFNAEATVDYLNTRYYVNRHNLSFNNSKLYLNKLSITDGYAKDGVPNTAIAEGYVDLRDFKNIRLNIDITSNNFLFMNTTRQHNSAFYGTAYGSGLVRFTGPIDALQLYVNARSEKGTYIYLPMDEEDEYVENEIYTFINTGTEEDTVKVEEEVTLSGMNMTLDLDITPDAEMQIIFDLQSGDVITSRGDGRMKINVNTIGDFNFTIHGNYKIKEGDYLFTFQNWYFKYFTLEEGGTIDFIGDPYQARLNVSAIYSLKASRYNLLSDEEKTALASEPDLKKQVPIGVYMTLSGILSNPNIAFQIKQQETRTGRVYNAAQNRLTKMASENINELSKQVFGLLVMNDFIPAESYAINVGESVNTTVSEMVSNYFSNLLNDALSNVLPGSELNVKWRNYQSGDIDPSTRNEIELEYTQRLFNDRLSFNIGGNVDVGNQSTETNNENPVAIAGDFVVEYKITPDGRIRIKAFNKFDYDIFYGDYNKVGASIYITEEFDNFKELFDRGQKKKKKKEKKKAKIKTNAGVE